MVAAMDELEQKYRALVERISDYPMSEAARARILAEIEAQFTAARAADQVIFTERQNVGMCGVLAAIRRVFVGIIAVGATCITATIAMADARNSLAESGYRSCVSDGNDPAYCARIYGMKGKKTLADMAEDAYQACLNNGNGSGYCGCLRNGNDRAYCARIYGVTDRAKPAATPTPEPKPSAAIGISTGTGFLVDLRGTVVTSNHVVEGATEITVRCGQGAPKSAKLISASRLIDIATLQVTPDGPEYLTFAPTRSAMSGTHVFTFGYPLSSLLGAEPKYTDGAISSMSGLGGEQTYMQISIPIQPGNSGGPVVNDKGQVVGIIAAAAAIEPFLKSTGTLPQNINWAVKAEHAAVLFDAPPPLPPAKSQREAIDRVRRATCYIEAR